MSPEEMRTRLPFYEAALKSFSTSQSPFKIIHTLPALKPASQSTPLKTLFILDSSFNPPTLAHLRIALSALSSTSQSSRLLLLLSTKNADKAAQPAPFPSRLLMIELFSRSLSTLAPNIAIDIGLTTLPYFVHKASAISSYTCSSQPELGYTEQGVEQVHLVGYDTLLRILEPKYYPPEHRLDSLVPFLEKHRLRVTYREGGDWGGRGEQDAFLRGVGEGSLEGVGGRREWVLDGRIELVEGKREGEEVVSSTKVRDAVKRGDDEALERLVPEGVRVWIRQERLYSDS